jgi:multiple sugar transport system permease protein
MTKDRRDLFAALGFLLPNLLGFLVFVAFPIFFSFFLLFTNWSIKPAVELRFAGLENVIRLVGFRLVEGADGGAAALSMVAMLACWLVLVAGVYFSLTDLGRVRKGLRLGGFLLLTMGVIWVLVAIGGLRGVGWGLMGLLALFCSVFFLSSDDEGEWGPGAFGPLLVIGGIELIGLAQPWFFQMWEAIDPLFWSYLYNTLYLMIGIPLSIAGSLLLALALNRPMFSMEWRRRMMLALVLGLIAVAGGVITWFRVGPDAAVLWITFWLIAASGPLMGVVAFRTMFYLPTFTAGVAIMLLWKQMFNPEFGPLNESIRLFLATFGIGFEGPRWLTSPDWAKPALILMGLWMAVGGANMLLYLAGLANIPEDLYEAARIDGAGRLQIFRAVTWPQLAPTTFFIVIMSTIAGLQGGFEQARVMTNGGPAGSTKTLAFYVYEKAFIELELGYASAIAWVLFVIVFALTALNWRFGNQYVND